MNPHKASKAFDWGQIHKKSYFWRTDLLRSKQVFIVH